MTDNGPHMTAEQARRSGASAASPVAEQCAAQRGPRWKRILKRVGIGIGVTVVVLVVLGVSLYEWGGMSGSVDPTMPARYAAMVAQAKAPPIQARFVIPIPGCVCHSTDPVQTAKHRVYRMSECGRCHNGGETAQEAPVQ